MSIPPIHRSKRLSARLLQPRSPTTLTASGQRLPSGISDRSQNDRRQFAMRPAWPQLGQIHSMASSAAITAVTIALHLLQRHCLASTAVAGALAAATTRPRNSAKRRADPDFGPIAPFSSRKWERSVIYIAPHSTRPESTHAIQHRALPIPWGRNIHDAVTVNPRLPPN